MKILFVGGDFNDDGGRPSGYCKKMIEELNGRIGTEVSSMNGGEFSFLEFVLTKIHRYDVVFWFANVPNDKPKLIREVKKLNKTCMLVTSKSNMDGEYSFQDLVGRALQNKANMLVEFTKQSDSFGGTIFAKVIDPLGNEWCDTNSVGMLVTSLLERLGRLMKFTRVGCNWVGEEKKPILYLENSEKDRFFKYINQKADEFHKLIHGANTDRMLGNASFRCTKGGFPSMRAGDLIYVSRRNIDKRDIGANGFVACDANSLVNGSLVNYYGDNKPSVDTPIQLCLYSYYHNINFMIHSHTYIKDAPMTAVKVPCGALEECAEIFSVMPWQDIEHFAINLKGHGSIILANEVSYLHHYKHIARPMPEV